MLSDGGPTTDRAAGIERAKPGEVRVRRALLSVSDKRGIVDFARGLEELGVEVVSTGGTARELSAAGIAARGIEDLTGFPEIMDGRVKTLHPRLYAGLLAVRDNPEHLRAAAEHDIEYVDLVCVNLYPFEATAGRHAVSEAEVIDNSELRAPARALAGPPAPRQADLLQQRARPRCRARARGRVRRAGVHDRQAQQPVRRRGRLRGARGLPPRVRVRPTQRLRRGDRAQPPG